MLLRSLSTTAFIFFTATERQRITIQNFSVCLFLSLIQLQHNTCPCKIHCWTRTSIKTKDPIQNFIHVLQHISFRFHSQIQSNRIYKYNQNCTLKISYSLKTLLQPRCPHTHKKFIQKQAHLNREMKQNETTYWKGCIKVIDDKVQRKQERINLRRRGTSMDGIAKRQLLTELVDKEFATIGALLIGTFISTIELGQPIAEQGADNRRSSLGQSSFISGLLLEDAAGDASSF